MSSNINRIVKEATKKPKRKIVDVDVMQSYGTEPDWSNVKVTDEDYSTKIGHALNWVNAMLDHKELRDQTFIYLDMLKIDYSSLLNIKLWKFMQIGKLCWLANNNCPFNDNLKRSLDKSIKELFENIEVSNFDEEIEDVEVTKISRSEIKQRNQVKKTHEYLAFIYDEIDKIVLTKVEDESVVYQHLSNEEVDPKIVKILNSQLESRYQELQNELDSLSNMSEDNIILFYDDKQTFNKYFQDIGANLTAYKNVISQVTSYLGNKKALKRSERKIGSKIKAKRIENQISNLKFKVQDSNYKISSINPIDVIDSQTLVTFNTKTRKISIFVANNNEGLSIKGTTIQNFDESKSVQKTLRKPEMLPQIQSGTIMRLKVLFEDTLTTKAAPTTGRINQDVILMRTFKDTYPPK